MDMSVSIPGGYGGTLHPAQPGEVRNPKGRGNSKNVSTIIRETLEGEIDWSTIPVKQAKQLAKSAKGKAGWQILVGVAIAKAMEGDMRAFNWLSKAGYGDKLIVESENDLFDTGKLEITIVDPKRLPTSQDEPDAGSSS